MDAFELFNEKGIACGVWCCGKCRKLVLSPLYNFGSDEPKSTREVAEACCRPRLCETCGNEIDKSRYRSENLCDSCYDANWRQKSLERQRELLDKATLVEGVDGPFYLEGFDGDWGDDYHSDVDHLIESIVDSECIYDEDGGVDLEAVPEFAFCCDSRIERMDIGTVLENLCSDGYEEMGDRVVVPKCLEDAVAEFNKINESALTVYSVDYKRKIAIRQMVVDAAKEANSK